MLTNYPDVTRYIHDYWAGVAVAPGKKINGPLINKLIRYGSIPLPATIISPNNDSYAGTFWYWHTYFIVLGLVVDGYGGLAKGLVDNLCALQSQYSLIPAYNSTQSRQVSAPPFLTRMAWEVYEHGAADDKWLGQVMSVAAREYEQVWCQPPRYFEEIGLSGFSQRQTGPFFRVQEHGWKASGRFASKNLIAPVDLNAQLYVYEEDLANWAERFAPEQATIWQQRLQKRKALTEAYFWDEKTGFFYDYDLTIKSLAPTKSIAGFYPLWAGAAMPEQAERVISQLEEFEQPFGVITTVEQETTPKEWDYPNAHPAFQYIVVSALRRYGYNDLAARISRKWLDLNSEIFKDTHTLWETYDVVSGTVGKAGSGSAQKGFSSTCAVFQRLNADLEDL